MRPPDREQPAQPPQPPVLAPPGAGTSGPATVGEELLRIDGDTYEPTFTSAGELVTNGVGGIYVWDVRAGRELRHLPDAGPNATLSPDGRRVAIVRGSTEIVVRSLSDDGEVTIAHRSSIWKRGLGGVSAVAFSPDGARLASAGDPDTRLWSVADGSELARIPTGPTEFYGVIVAFSPDGRYLATSATERSADIWDVSDGRRVQHLDHRPHRYGRVAVAVAFSPDSRRLATLCADCVRVDLGCRQRAPGARARAAASLDRRASTRARSPGARMRRGSSSPATTARSAPATPRPATRSCASSTATRRRARRPRAGSVSTRCSA